MTEEIANIIRWYKNVPQEFKHLGQLQEARRKLAGYMFAFGPVLAEATAEAKQKSYIVIILL